MSNQLKVAGIAGGIILALLLVGGLGFGIASADDQAVTDRAVAEALAAVTPEPTPEPTPIPTPWIIAPPECIDAIDMLIAQSLPDLQFVLDVLNAYVDHPTENLTEFGQRVEVLIGALDTPSSVDNDRLTALNGACRAAGNP